MSVVRLSSATLHKRPCSHLIVIDDVTARSHLNAEILVLFTVLPGIRQGPRRDCYERQAGKYRLPHMQVASRAAIPAREHARPPYRQRSKRALTGHCRVNAINENSAAAVGRAIPSRLTAFVGRKRRSVVVGSRTKADENRGAVVHQPELRCP